MHPEGIAPCKQREKILEIKEEQEIDGDSRRQHRLLQAFSLSKSQNCQSDEEVEGNRGAEKYRKTKVRPGIENDRGERQPDSRGAMIERPEEIISEESDGEEDEDETQ